MSVMSDIHSRGVLIVDAWAEYFTYSAINTVDGISKSQEVDTERQRLFNHATSLQEELEMLVGKAWAEEIIKSILDDFAKSDA